MIFKEWIENSHYAHFDKKNLHSISCDSCDIDSLEGIEEYPNLESFQCCDNFLSDLKGIENLKNLRMLTIYNNRIESLKGIEDLPELKRLYCVGNYITQREHMRIPFLKLVDLDWDCNIDQFRNMDLVDIKKFLQSKVNKVFKSFNESIIKFKDFR